MDMERIQDIATSAMKLKSSHPWKEPGNKYDHGIRVAKLLTELAARLGYHESLDILIVSAWFHDICNGIEGHEQAGAKETVRLLEEYCTHSQLAEIYDLISLHDSRTADGLSDACNLLQDADLLDHFGVHDIWTGFQYAFREKLSFLESAEVLFTHHQEHRLRYRNELHYEISKLIFDEKITYTERFLERMLIEGAGKIVE